MHEVYYKPFVVLIYIGGDVRKAVAANRRQRAIGCTSEKTARKQTCHSGECR